jgi:glycosyltransferase involved in cell wall biosynthesis
MKVAFILPKLSNQGPVIVARDIIDNIKDRVELIDVYYFDDFIEVNFNCNIYKISLFDKINFNKYDVIHSHMLRPDFYVWCHKKKNNTSLFVSTLHQNIYDNLKGNYNSFVAYLFEKLWLFFLRKQDIVVTLTEVMQNFYAQKSKLKLKTIYNGRKYPKYYEDVANEEDVININLLKSNYKLIGSHCLLTRRKGIHQIIKSLLLLEDYALVVVGNGQELENLKKIAKDLNVIDRCFFLGYRKDAVAYLKYFDLYVMSSYSEGFPLGLLEAGLCKLPIVCSDLPIFRELFTEKEVCFFELDDDFSLAQSIRLCYKNNEELSNSIFHLICEKYSVNNMGDNYMELYQSKIKI